jgi:hypothetical protein
MQQKFPVKTSWQLSKLGQSINKPLEAVEEARQALIKKHGEEDEKGQLVIKANTKNMASYVEEYADLMSLEVELEFEKVKLPLTAAATCDKCHHNIDKEFQIEPYILMALDNFIEI